MIRDAGGRQSQPVSRYFATLPKVSGEEALTGYYWFDNETKPRGEVSGTSAVLSIDASSLTNGFHRFCYIAAQGNSAISTETHNYFLKVGPEAKDSLDCLCSVDGQLMYTEKLPSQGGVVHWDLDMSGLADGVHRIQMQSITKDGIMCGSYSNYFLRVTTAEEQGELRCLYAIDNGKFSTVDNVVMKNGANHFDLDLSGLADGVHHVSYMLCNKRGGGKNIQTRFFVKVPDGGNGIDLYQYWLNDDDFSKAVTVRQPQRVNPLQLMTLQPVESRPLRSSQFYFTVEGGQPVIYARNTLHLRFYDAALRFTEAEREYTDYTVGQSLTDMEELLSDVPSTTVRPAENTVKWYWLSAQKGDSLCFKTDVAATLQLFDPSGEELYAAMGTDAVKWGGVRAQESGKYYVALHDVTAEQATTVSVDFKLFRILADVNGDGEVGIGDIVAITNIMAGTK